MMWDCLPIAQLQMQVDVEVEQSGKMNLKPADDYDRL